MIISTIANRNLSLKNHVYMYVLNIIIIEGLVAMRVKTPVVITIICLCTVASLAASSSDPSDTNNPGGTTTHYAPARMPVMSAKLLIANDRLFTYVSVNGQKKKLFFVDNGWSHTTVDPRLVREFTMVAEKNVAYKALDKKRVEATSGFIDSMTVGDLEIIAPRVRKSELMAVLSRGVNKRVFGVLAYQTMSPYLTTFDFKSKQVLFSGHDKENLNRILGNENLISLDFGPSTWSKQSKQIFSVRMKLNGREVDAVVDLGYNGGVLTTLDASDLGMDRFFPNKSFDVAIGGHKGKGYRHELRTAEIGGQTFNGIHIILFKTEQAPQFTIIGVNFLKKFEVTFDYKNKKLYLVPYA